MTVIKRTAANSVKDLLNAIDTLCPLLLDQKEGEAVDQLQEASRALSGSEQGTAEFKEAVGKIVDAFEGDHELIAYTFQRENPKGEWTLVEELNEASSRVLSLAKRFS